MEFKEVIAEEHDEIVKRLKKDGYANKVIDYSGFLDIYSNYLDMMSELEFAYLLGLSYDKFRSLRTKGTRTTILVQEASLELRDFVVEKLRKEGYSNRLVDYHEFLELYKDYEKEITEKEFAKIIGISSTRFRNIKNRGGKTCILKIKVDEELIHLEVKKRYGSILVDYRGFLNIYDEYKDILNDERRFADILGISSDNFSAMKNRGTKAMILKDDGISSELSQKIVSEVLNKGLGNKLITYKQFLELYEVYANILTEVQFAKILKISSLKYRNMKYYDCKTYVFGKSENEVSLERKEEIIKELIDEGYANKSVTYLEFKEIYKKYDKEMSEVQFAEILGISYSNLSTIKGKGCRAIIFRSRKVSQAILDEIACDKRIICLTGNLIDYNCFETLYKPYVKYVTEREFAEIIGISSTGFNNIRSYRVKVDGIRSERLRIKHVFRESRIYYLDEINDFCVKYNCSIRDIFRVICQTENDIIIDEYVELLRKKGIFLGYHSVDDSIFNKYGEHIIRIIDSKSKKLASFYRQNNFSDDITSDTIMYIMQKRGDIFINFSEERALQIIEYVAIKYMKILYLSRLKSSNVSFDKIGEVCGDHNNYMSDKSLNIEKEAIDRIRSYDYDDVINFFEEYYERGYSVSDIIDGISKKMKMDGNEVCELLKKKLLEKNEIKQTSNGEYYLGRKLNE